MLSRLYASTLFLASSKKNITINLRGAGATRTHMREPGLSAKSIQAELSMYDIAFFQGAESVVLNSPFASK